VKNKTFFLIPAQEGLGVGQNLYFMVNAFKCDLPLVWIMQLNDGTWYCMFWKLICP